MVKILRILRVVRWVLVSLLFLTIFITVLGMDYPFGRIYYCDLWIKDMPTITREVGLKEYNKYHVDFKTEQLDRAVNRELKLARKILPLEVYLVTHEKQVNYIGRGINIAFIFVCMFIEFAPKALDKVKV